MNRPETVVDLQEIVRIHPRIRPVAGFSKPALSSSKKEEAVTLLDMRSLSGILEYDPNEYTFTAYAGTPISEMTAALAEHGQYLPCDSLFAAAGATLGGTIAANTSGSGRFRYGGVRDFILGIRFVDGLGRLVQGGGKVVKNAAGFDLPKFFVGSLGRYGVLAEVTFKVFPRPAAYTTLVFAYAGLAEALQATFSLATTPFEIEALDIRPSSAGSVELFVRLGGLPQGLPQRVVRMRDFLLNNTGIIGPKEKNLLSGPDDQRFWDQWNAGYHLADTADYLVKVPLAPKQLLSLAASPAISRAHYGAGGNVAWLATTDLPKLSTQLNQLGLTGLVLRGDCSQPIIGRRQGVALLQRVKQALDPQNKFGEI